MPVSLLTGIPRVGDALHPTDTIPQTYEKLVQ